MSRPYAPPDRLSADDLGRWAGLAAEARRCARKPDRAPAKLDRLARAANGVRGSRKVGARLPAGHDHKDSAFVRLIAEARGWTGLTYVQRLGASEGLERLAAEVETALEAHGGRNTGAAHLGGAAQAAPLRRERADIDG